ncbi:hypothetical protein CDD83_10510 [Cordyceps sp. RAO-2017]|nr:hypothetical protein CDD83_10510 [Cordyceps sp. RAO-2017]
MKAFVYLAAFFAGQALASPHHLPHKRAAETVKAVGEQSEQQPQPTAQGVQKTDTKDLGAFDKKNPNNVCDKNRLHPVKCREFIQKCHNEMVENKNFPAKPDLIDTALKECVEKEVASGRVTDLMFPEDE